MHQLKKYTVIDFMSFQSGSTIITSLLVATIIIVMMTGMVGWAVLQAKYFTGRVNRESAFQIAEAGIDYYRWHLAHAPGDYQDGTGQPGPYSHDFYDKDNNLIGRYELTILPPPVGSTLVDITSVGYTLVQPNLKRKLRTQLGIPSLGKYAVASHDNIRFGVGTEVFGPIHANGGIRFDGVAHNLVTSAQTCYDDPDTGTVNPCERPGVWTSVSPESSVFLAGKQFPVPLIDFGGFTQDLADIKAAAQSSGKYFAPSGVSGYHIVFKTDNTFDLYRVNSLVSSPSGSCTQSQTQSNPIYQQGWGLWSINTQTFLANHQVPANGSIFVEDHVWVNGQINNARLTLASGRFPENPSTNTNIIINNDLLYTNYDGTDVIGLIAQRGIVVGLNSEDDLQIDAAVVAKNGRVGRYYYNSQCSATNYKRQKITINGMIASFLRYGFAYGSAVTVTSGYQTRNINYDANLLYSPPPNFPLTSDQYNLISWEEVR